MKLTSKVVLELLEAEALVREAYRDSRGIWTWGVGVTDASGHKVQRYRDNPQTIQHCLGIYLWLLETKYLPDVEKAFVGHELKEHEVAGALSFHYNTGAIGRADWVKSWKAGEKEQAWREFMNYSKPVEIIGRRKLERDLFFNAHWTSDGFITVYEVSKPSYTPKWSSAKQVDVRKDLEELL